MLLASVHFPYLILKIQTRFFFSCKQLNLSCIGRSALGSDRFWLRALKCGIEAACMAHLLLGFEAGSTSYFLTCGHVG